MINDKLFLIVVLTLVLMLGCVSKPQIKPSEVKPPEGKPIFSLAEKRPVTGEESRVEPAIQGLELEEKPTPRVQEPAQAGTEPERPAITEPEKREEFRLGVDLETEKIGILDFNEEKLCNVLKIVSAVTGVNLVAKENISELEVTIFLKDVSPRTALEALCRQYGLWYEEGDGYIRLVKVENFGRVVVSDGKIELLMFKGLPLARVLSILSEQTGKNVVCKGNIDEDIKVHLLLRGVPVITAVEAICKKYNLWYTEDNDKNYICLMKADDYGKDMGLDYQVKTRVFNLKYASAPQLADSIACVMGDRVEYALPANLRSYEHLKLPDVKEEGGRIEQAKIEESITEDVELPEVEKALKQNITSEKIEELIKTNLDLMLTARDVRWINKEIGFALITIFLRNNAIIACSTDDGILEEIGELIEKLDTPTPQVLIECRILDVSLSDDFTSFFQITNFARRQKGGESYGEDTQIWEAPFFGAAGAEVLYNFVDDKWKLDAKLTLLKEEGIIKVVSTPMLITAQNAQAVIDSGMKNYPFFSGVDVVPPVVPETGPVIPGYTVPVYERVDLVGTTLSITPQINEDRTVTLRVYVERSKVEEKAAEIQYATFDKDGNPKSPWDKTRVDVKVQNSINTIVCVPEGHTLALGGLVEENDSVVESKVPFLGDIPIIGFFFRDHETVKRRSETVFLLTPHVIMAPEEVGAVSEKALEGIEHPIVKEGKKKLFEFDEERKRLRRVE